MQPILATRAFGLSLLAMMAIVGLVACSNGERKGKILVYGATSGGIAAALAADRNHSFVILLDANTPLGGMSSQGLGAADTGNAETIGGIASEFYRRVGDKYGQAVSYFFEPHVSQTVFSEMLAESNVTLVRNARIAKVVKDGAVIQHVITQE